MDDFVASLHCLFPYGDFRSRAVNEMTEKEAVSRIAMKCPPVRGCSQNPRPRTSTART